MAVTGPGGVPGAGSDAALAGGPVAGLAGGPVADRVARPPLTDCRARDVLQRVGDKWSVFVIDRLGQGSQRFSELRKSIDGITGRMLTVTLRGLERDGLVARTVHPVIPPRVDYELTAMGVTLLATIEQLVDWADGHADDIYAARYRYDRRHAQDEGRGAADPCMADETGCPDDGGACGS